MSTLELENEKLTELILKISSELAVLNAQSKQQLDSISKALDTIANHENRLTKLETTDKAGLKTTVIEWAVKGLVVAVIALGSIGGAGAVIAKFLGQM